MYNTSHISQVIVDLLFSIQNDKFVYMMAGLVDDMGDFILHS